MAADLENENNSDQKMKDPDKNTVLTKARHFEKIEACKTEAQLWLPKERVKIILKYNLS